MKSKMNIEKEQDFNYCSTSSDVAETGLVFQFLNPVKTNHDKGDNYNVPLEGLCEESSCVEAPIPKEKVPKTYKKVIEVYEMNEAEINIANKIRYILKLIFKGFFKEDILYAWCAGLSYGVIAFDLIEQKYLQALIMFTYSLLYTDVKKGFKTLADYFSSKTRIKLEDYLARYGILEYTNDLVSSDDVKMYVKYRRNK